MCYTVSRASRCLLRYLIVTCSRRGNVRRVHHRQQRLSWSGRPPEGPARVRVRVPPPRSRESGRRISVRLRSVVVALVLSSGVLYCPVLEASPVNVRQTEGVVHGFLVLRTLD